MADEVLVIYTRTCLRTFHILSNAHKPPEALPAPGTRNDAETLTIQNGRLETRRGPLFSLTTFCEDNGATNSWRRIVSSKTINLRLSQLQGG